MGRALGWILLFLALILAASEGMLWLADQETHGLSNGELWGLVLDPPTLTASSSVFAGWIDTLLALPAWSGISALSLVFLLTSRKRQRPKRKMMFETMRSSALH